MEKLINRVQAITTEAGGTWGIVLKDITTNERWAFNEREMFYSASVVKIPIMAAVYQAAEQGKFTLDDKLPLNAKDLVGGAGVLQHMTPGTKIAIRDIVTLMIIQSDNSATNILIDLAGVEFIAEFMKEIGMTDSTFYNKLMIKSSKRTGSNMTNALDNATFLEKLHNGEIVSAQASKSMLNIMRKQQVKNCLPHKLPYQEIKTDDEGPPWKLAHKTGWIPGLRHDVGIFYVESKPFIASVFSKDVNDLASEAALADIGKEIYTYLS